MPGKRCTEEVKIAAVKQQRGHRVSEVTERLGVSIQGRRVRSAIRTRTEALGVVDAGSVEKLIRTTNARPRRAGLPRSGSRWRIRRARRRPARFRQAIKNLPRAVSLFSGGSGVMRIASVGKALAHHVNHYTY